MLIRERFGGILFPFALCIHIWVYLLRLNILILTPFYTPLFVYVSTKNFGYSDEYTSDTAFTYSCREQCPELVRECTICKFGSGSSCPLSPEHS